MKEGTKQVVKEVVKCGIYFGTGCLFGTPLVGCWQVMGKGHIIAKVCTFVASCGLACKASEIAWDGVEKYYIDPMFSLFEDTKWVEPDTVF